MPSRKKPQGDAAADAPSTTDPDTLTPLRARTRRNGQPLTDDERAAAQAAFLLVYARTGNVSQAARRARISRETYYQWRNHDTTFAAHLVHANEDAQDVLRKETFRRAVVGVNEPLTNGQGLIYEYEVVVGPDGEPVLDDRGRPKLRRGKMATVKKYSDGLLQTMLKARVPEYRDQKRQYEISGPNGGPLQTRNDHTLTLRPGDLSDDELDAMMAIYQQALARKRDSESATDEHAEHADDGRGRRRLPPPGN